MHLFLPLLAAIAFAAGSLVYKRAFTEGAGIAHALVVNNVALGIAFLPLAWLDPQPIPWHLAHLPVITASAFVGGHLMNVVSLKIGDVSVASPLLGSKVVFVALVARLVFGWPVTGIQMFAAGLTTAGVLVMGFSDARPGRRTSLTIALSLTCAAAFAVTDVLIQLWAADFGVFNFLSLLFASLAVFSLLILPFLGRESLRAPLTAWKWIAGATALSALQAIIITWTIGHWRDAAGVNIVYGTRGLWTIALVWWAGRWFGNTERRSVGGRVLAGRLAGAILILAALVLAVVGAGKAVAGDLSQAYSAALEGR
jgi:drug/metabolite transporter (DMT)-like permease